MEIFDSGKKERQMMWHRIGNLEQYTQELKTKIDTRASDDEKAARQSSKKASEFRNKIEAKLKESNQFVEQISSELELVRNIKEEINTLGNDASQQKDLVDESKGRLDQVETEFENKIEVINLKIGQLEDILEKYPNLESQLSKIDDFTLKIEENLGKSGVSLSAINKRKTEIDDLHLEIFGYTETDGETGEETNIEGLKDELNSSYVGLKSDIENSKKSIEDLKNDYQNSYNSFEEEYKKKYKKITDDIASLLPDAMTAGLSSAFSNKKDDEVELSDTLRDRFNLGIYLMIAISMIPAAISIIFLYQGTTFDEVIMRLPRLVLAIVPMYIPVLWFTYSANKKLNLSKRLIEEYAHKEVLSKTYEGLSTQIENIEDPEQSEELKFRLLSNFLHASSENPGKLISNYEASDHPVMDALEQSYKFQMTVDKLEGIPGMGKVAAILERRAKNKIAKKEKILDKALSNVDVNDLEDIEEESEV